VVLAIEGMLKKTYRTVKDANMNNKWNMSLEKQI
jgi:hypothetical protein